MLAKAGGQPTDTAAGVMTTTRAVVVASPNDRHLDDLNGAMQGGLHCFVEKPLAHHAGGVAELLALAHRKNLVVFCGFNLRFHPCVIAARAALDAGKIGRPIRAQIECASYLPNWRPGTDYRKSYAANPATGGVVFDVIHEIDVALFLFGAAQVTAASAYCSGYLDMPSDDVADFVLRHSSGVSSAVHLDYVTRPPLRRTRVVGTEGSLEIDLIARTLTRLSPAGQVAESIAYPGSFTEDYREEMIAFLARIDGRPGAGADGEDGLRALKVALDVRHMSGLPNV